MPFTRGNGQAIPDVPTPSEQHACEWDVQKVGISVGVKSGNIHIADMRVCEYTRRHAWVDSYVKLRFNDSRTITGVIDTLPRLPLTAGDAIYHAPRYYTDENTTLPLDDNDIAVADIHEWRPLGLVANLLADHKISKAAEGACRYYGVDANPATACVALWTIRKR